MLGSACDVSDDSGATNGLGRDETSAWFGVLTSVDTSGVHCRGKARRFSFDDEELAVNTFSLLTYSVSLRRFKADGCAPSGASKDWRLREGMGSSIISKVGSRVNPSD